MKLKPIFLINAILVTFCMIIILYSCKSNNDEEETLPIITTSTSIIIITTTSIFTSTPTTTIPTTTATTNFLCNLIGTDFVGDASNSAGDLITLRLCATQTTTSGEYILTFNVNSSNDQCTNGVKVTMTGWNPISNTYSNEYFIGWHNGNGISGYYDGISYIYDTPTNGTQSCNGAIGTFSIDTNVWSEFEATLDSSSNNYSACFYVSSLTATDEIGDQLQQGTNSLICYELPTVTISRWTFMVYMDGDNNLEYNAIADFNEMEAATIPSDVNIIILFDRITGYDTTNGNWTDTRAFKVQSDANPSTIYSPRIAIPSLGVTAIGSSVELNMGSSKTLQDFLTFCKNNYPATNYALIIWDHGAGWRGKSIGGWKAAVSDDTNSSILYNNQIRTEITNVMGSSSSKSLDVICFDACIMGNAETAFEFRNVASYMAVSMQNEPVQGYWYGGTSYGGGLFDRFFARTTANQTPANFVIDVVDSYREYYNGSGQSETLTAIDLSYMDTLASQVETWTTSTPQTRTTLGVANNSALNYNSYFPYYLYNLYQITLYATSPSSTAAVNIRNTLTSMTLNNYNAGNDSIPGLAIHCGYASVASGEFSNNAAYTCTNILWACTGGTPSYAALIAGASSTF